MALHNPREFDGRCPECNGHIIFLDFITNYLGEKEHKYLCDECKILIRVNCETDEVETEDTYE